MQTHALEAFHISSDLVKLLRERPLRAGSRPLINADVLERLIQLSHIGREAGVRTLLQLFISTCEGGLASIKQCVAARDVDRLRGEIHKLRSAVGTFGAEEMSFRLERLEWLARAGRYRMAATTYLKLETVWAQTKHEVMTRFDAKQAGDFPTPMGSAVRETQDGPLKILVVEDSELDRALVRVSLESQYDVTDVCSAEEGIQECQNGRFDAVIIDVNLPGLDGFELCRKFRVMPSMSQVPILFLSVRSGAEDRVQAFELGADDYIVKPFDSMELRLRLEARLKGTRQEDLVPTRFGDLEIDTSLQKGFLWFRGKRRDLELTPGEFRLVCYFVRHPGKVLTRKDLLVAIWGGNVYVLDRTVDKHVCSLRQKLGERSTYIVTVPRSGYVFKC